jgi:micrococcal nuclease
LDTGTRIFWTILAALLGASVFFGVQGERQRGEAQKAGASVQTGDLVTLASVTDGDSIVVTNPAGDTVALRILGVKAMEGAPGKDPFAVYATEAANALRRTLGDKPARVLLGVPPKDKHGRALATLFVDDRDVGLGMISDGLALVYTAYPFPAMQRYLDEQSRAKADRKGLWADPVATARAELLLGVWRKEAP